MIAGQESGSARHAGRTGAGCAPESSAARRRSPFSRVEFLTLSSDADPDRYAHGDGDMRGHLENQGQSLGTIPKEPRLIPKEPRLTISTSLSPGKPSDGE